MGAFNFIGTIASGWLTDRYDPRKLLLIYYGFRGVSLLFLPLIHDSVSIVRSRSCSGSTTSRPCRRP